MFDIGGWEFLIIIVVAIVIVGPKDLPGLVRTISEWIRRARGLARDFQGGLDDLAREVDIDNLGNEVKQGIGLDDSGTSLRQEIENTIDPRGEIADAFNDSEDLLDANPLDDDEEFALDDDAEDLILDDEDDQQLADDNLRDENLQEIESKPGEPDDPEQTLAETQGEKKVDTPPEAKEA
jgi:sec-independent protein translocase protein TatB